MKKANRWAGSAILLLPPVALGGVALWTQRRMATRDEAGPLRVVIQKVEPQQPTPRDVAEGFDTRVEVTLGYAGPQVNLWGDKAMSWGGGQLRLFDAGSRGSKPRFWTGLKLDHDLAARPTRFDAASQTYKNVFLFRLAQHPGSPRAVRCEIAPSGTIFPNGRPERVIGGAPLTFAVLSAGEKATAPRFVLHDSPLSVREIKTRFLDSTPDRDAAILVEATFHADEIPDGPAPLYFIGEPYLEDGAGQRHPWSQGGSNGSVEGGSTACHWQFNDADTLRKARKLTFHGRVSLNENWPVDVQAVLWDHTAQKPKK